MLKSIINNFEKVDLTVDDVYEITNNTCKVVVYHELKGYTSLDQLFSDTDTIVLLYETKYNFGHWIVLIMDAANNILYVFDSYGFGKLDAELNYAKYDNIPYLTNFVNQARANNNLRVDINTVQMQDTLSDINTCGRHCCVRVLFKNLTNDQYNRLFASNQLRTPDELVTAFTMLFDLRNPGKFGNANA
jgi:hypothetical protein